jgi:hypothetical protein
MSHQRHFFARYTRLALRDSLLLFFAPTDEAARLQIHFQEPDAPSRILFLSTATRLLYTLNPTHSLCNGARASLPL